MCAHALQLAYKKLLRLATLQFVDLLLHKLKATLSSASLRNKYRLTVTQQPVYSQKL
jgi:hypothetical protein